MPICAKCDGKFPSWIKVDGKKKNVSNRKYCIDCSPFGKHNTKKLHINVPENCICKRCQREYKYVRGKGHTHLYCNSCNVTISRGNIKEKAVEYKGGKCEVCGYSKCIASLCFHHEDPDKKDFTIGNQYFLGWNKIKKEIDKCMLLCLNCHHEIHYNKH